MAFNYRFPDPIPPLDTAAFVKALASPEKATELLAKYEKARKEYEALRVAIAAEMQALKVELASVATKKTDVDSTGKKLAERELALETEKKDFSKTRNRIADELAKQTALLNAKTAELAAKERAVSEAASAAETLKKQLAEQEKAQQKAAQNKTWQLTARENALKEREADITSREEKAEKLAQLLKGV